MNESIASARQKLRKKFASNKFLAICILFSVSLIISIISALSIQTESVDSITESVNQIVSILKSYVGSEFVKFAQPILKALNYIKTFIIIATVLSFIPQIVSVVAVWLMKTGSNGNEQNVKKSILGLNVYKVYCLLNIISNLTVAIILIFIAISLIIAMILIKAPAITIIVGIMITLVVYLVLFLFAKYYGDFMNILTGITTTLRINRNCLVNSKFVIITSYIYGIYTIISGFSNGFWSIISSACMGIGIILATNFISKTATEFGAINTNNNNELYENLCYNPEYYNLATGLGIKQSTTTTDEISKKMKRTAYSKVYLKLLFGSSVLKNDLDETPRDTKADIEEIIEATEESHLTIDTKKSTPYTTSVTKPKIKHIPLKELDVNIINIFDSKKAELDSRFSTIGIIRSPIEISCPIKIDNILVIKDSISEKKILRMIMRNTSEEEIKRVILQIVLKTNLAKAIGVMKNVEFILDETECLDYLGANYGIILPDEATNGIVKILRIDFASGLFWDKGSDDIVFTTDEKIQHDVDFYLNMIAKDQNKNE